MEHCEIEFTTIDGKRVPSCLRCGKKYAPTESEAVHAVCKKPRGPCASLGKQVRLEKCLSCTGSVKVKVFACGVFGECTLAKSIQGIANCQRCKSFKARE